MRIPANIIKSKYTSGNEFIYKLNYKFYQGHYYELNDRFFVGKEFNADAPELIKASNNTEVNDLLTRAATFIYGYISKNKLSNNKPASFLYDNQSTSRYYLSKVNIIPILIKEVSKDTYEKFQNDPLYKSVVLSYKGGFSEKELNEAEKKMPGIITFVNTSYLPPSIEESGLVG